MNKFIKYALILTVIGISTTEMIQGGDGSNIQRKEESSSSFEIDLSNILVTNDVPTARSKPSFLKNGKKDIKSYFKNRFTKTNYCNPLVFSLSVEKHIPCIGDEDAGITRFFCLTAVDIAQLVMRAMLAKGLISGHQPVVSWSKWKVTRSDLIEAIFAGACTMLDYRYFLNGHDGGGKNPSVLLGLFSSLENLVENTMFIPLMYAAAKKAGMDTDSTWTKVCINAFGKSLVQNAAQAIAKKCL